MRTTAIATLALFLAACASQAPAPQSSASAKPESSVPAKSGAQCYSGEHEKFFPVGEKTTIAGVAVTCTATSDGKSGQWLGAKH